ncbi:MAG: 16S rRNA (adenine(1518)-N(6)/adenine(1519)-N(6))-dimethyltransferase RsmA [Clostridiales bacterium]|nr:16S rRNA (adenine(1518)-N(6)/adenine(1519)-N(6))-dimethyltransferase RsmA [Clostridiales bacterium]
MELTNVGVIKSILGRHGFSFTKSLGQNFLTNPSVAPKMAKEGGAGPGMAVLEIGPGLGVLTKELAKAADQVLAVELDKKLEPVLKETLGDFDNVEVVYGDILKLDLEKLINEKFANKDFVVCANLPYYITSPIIMLLLESSLPFKSLTLMVQREAADRICAPVGSRQAGALTVAVAYYAKAVKLFNVSRGSFLPQPKVDSCVIRLDLLEKPAIEVEDEAGFFRMVRAAFGQRRKTALNAISAGLDLPKEQVAEALKRAELAPNIRAEKLDMEQLGRLFKNLQI